jgi:hypothetical protein
MFNLTLVKIKHAYLLIIIYIILFTITSNLVMTYKGSLKLHFLIKFSLWFQLNQKINWLINRGNSHERKNWTHFGIKMSKFCLILNISIHKPQQCSRVISFFDRKHHSHLFAQVNIACINLTLFEIKRYNILLH